MTKSAERRDKLISKDFWIRLLTGFVLVVIVTCSVEYSLYNFMLVVLFINIFGLNEFYTLFHADNPKKYLGLVLSVILFITSTLVIDKLFSEKILIINIPVAFILFLLALYDHSPNPLLSWP